MCELCNDSGNCIECSNGLVVNEEGTCEESTIPKCAIKSNMDGHKCDVCNPFYSLTPDKSACVSCVQPNLNSGCRECVVDSNKVVSKCLNCIGNMRLDNGQCVFDNCLDYIGTSASLKLETAQCDICADGFGLDSQSHTCHQCDPEGVDNWDLCTDCSFDITGVNNDCTACVVTDTPANDKTLTVSEGEYPFHQCKFPEIENCD